MPGYKMKKWTLLILVALLLSLLAGCGGTNAPVASEQTPETQPLEPEAASPEVKENMSELATGEAACQKQEIQPVAESISTQFDVQYNQVMAWFCHGHEYEDILLALQTAEVSAVTADDLLKQLDQGQSWDEIWAQIDLIPATE